MIKLKPAFKDYLWGGTRLKEHYHKQTDLSILAESWEVSTHPDGPSVVDNGSDPALTLAQYIDDHTKVILGTSAQRFDRFPLLIKLIDADRDLSVQVHPGDAYALEVEKEYGKTEMWYVLEANKDSFVYYGVNQLLTQEQFRQAIAEGEVETILEKRPVKSGDVIFVEAGTIHAINAGMVVCEIQQNSNTTYRVYDYDRTDASGNKRELHIEQSVEVSNLIPIDRDFSPQAGPFQYDGYDVTELVTCEYFKTVLFDVRTEASFDVNDDSFAALVCIEGTLRVTNKDCVIDCIQGDSLFIPAASGVVELSGSGRAIVARV